MTTRNRAACDNQVVTICPSNCRYSLVEAIRAPDHWSVLNREPGQNWTTVRPHIAVIAGLRVCQFIATSRTEQANTRISCPTTEAGQRHFWRRELVWWLWWKWQRWSAYH